MPCGKGSSAPRPNRSCVAAAHRSGKPPSLTLKADLSPPDSSVSSRSKPELHWPVKPSKSKSLQSHNLVPLRRSQRPRFQLSDLSHQLDLRTIQFEAGVQIRGVTLVLGYASVLFIFQSGGAALDFRMRRFNIGLGQLVFQLRHFARSSQLLD